MRKYHNASLQGLELLLTVLLARNRQPHPAVAAGAPHAELAAGLVTLPSGLLAMVCEAIVTLKVRPGAAGTRAPVAVVGPYAECWKHYSYWMLFRCPTWSEPARIRSARALCAVVHG